jgi:AcrR family transcriptional regulator
MRDTGLTHGGSYKHFASKNELLVESLKEGFRETIDTLVRAAEQSLPGEAWKAIVKAYLRPEMCEHPEHGCPLAALGPELVSTGGQKNEAADRGGTRDLQEPHGAVHAWPANRGQRTGFLCDFFDDDRSSTDCPHAARSGARESAGQRERFSLAQLLTTTDRLFCRPLSGLASKLKLVSSLIGRHFREKPILRERRVPAPSVALVHQSHRQWQFSHSQSRSEAP